MTSYFIWFSVVLVVVNSVMFLVYAMEMDAIRKRISGANGFVFMVISFAAIGGSLVAALLTVLFSTILNGFYVLAASWASIAFWYWRLLRA